MYKTPASRGQKQDKQHETNRDEMTDIKQPMKQKFLIICGLAIKHQ